MRIFNAETANTEQLAIGQMVTVAVSGVGDEVIAQDIQVMNIVAGPITEIEPQLNRVTVLGQQVQLSEKTHIPPDSAGQTQLQKGDLLIVPTLQRHCH